METFDAAKIGECIAWMGEHAVYKYGESEVIKFSRFEQLAGADMWERMERDILIGKRFFGDYMLDTRIAASPNGKRRVLVQPFVSGRILRKEDLGDTDIVREFQELKAANDRMLAAGHVPVDLMSGVGLLFGTLRNVSLLDNKHLQLIDVMLIDLIPGPLARFAERRQNTIFASYLS